MGVDGAIAKKATEEAAAKKIAEEAAAKKAAGETSSVDTEESSTQTNDETKAIDDKKTSVAENATSQVSKKITSLFPVKKIVAAGIGVWGVKAGVDWGIHHFGAGK